MRWLIILFAFFIIITGKAQPTKADVQVSGLTCSMCSNAVLKSLKTISFIQEIKTDLEHASFSLTFKPGEKIKFEEIVARVEKAGFSVAAFVLEMHFSNITIDNTGYAKESDYGFLFTANKGSTLNGNVKLRFLDKGFVAAKEYRKGNVASVARKGVYTVELK